MVETYAKRVHTEQVVLDIGGEIGALILYAKAELCGREIEVSPEGNDTRRTHTAIWERRLGGRTLFVGVYPALAAGVYNVWGGGPQPISKVTIIGGQVAEVDCRDLLDASTPVPRGRHPHAHTGIPFPTITPDMLPPRYRNGGSVCTTPMGTAPMRYDEQGQVAWNEMWTDFCDLALAGGPPHRGTVLEPASPDEIQANLTDYERVVSEITRGLRMVTGLPIIYGEQPGWIGLQCDDEEMAYWLWCAITVENVAVRREGRMLFLPAGPSYGITKEIKNVITVVAKTHHYWTEHRDAISE